MSKSISDRFNSVSSSFSGAKLTETFNNIGGKQFANNTVHGSINIVEGESRGERCHSALCQGISDPFYDRQYIKRFLGKQNKVTPNTSQKMFEYILNIAKFKTWKNTRTHSQLLWIYGGTGLGKTPLTLFLINEFETKPEQTENFITLYYFCDSKTHTSNHAVSLLRGLMVLLLRARPELLDVLLSDYDIQKDSLFSQSPSSLEALWRNFVNMARDPRAGRVYCIIDGIDQCGEESLEHLLDIIKEFYEDEEEQYRLRQTQNTNPATQQQQGAGLQMLLISREAPKCISEALDKFPRIPLKKDVKRAINKTTKLASIARDVLRQEHARAATTTAVSTPAAPSQPSSSVSFNAAVSVPPITPASSISVNPTPVLCESLPSIFMASTPEVLAGNVAPSSSADTTHSDPVELADSTLPEISVPAQTEYVFDKPVAEDETYLEEDIEEEENQSLAIYIKERIAVLATERAYPEAVCSSLSIGLENRGDGTFLWVDLAIGEIKRYQPQDAEQVLAQLPEDPNEIYCSTLQSIPQNLVRLTIAILRWVLAARRPLFVQELGAALGLLNYQSFDTRALTLQGIAACGSMLTVEEDDTVHVTHNSVKDLLTGERSPLRTNASLSHFYVSLENTDGEIASLCIQYLELGCLTNGAVLPTDGQEKYFKHVAQYPLFPYAVEFWPSHLREATRPQINLSSPFFIKTSKIRKNWWLTYWPATTGKWSLLAPRNFSLLHMASYLNLPYLAQQLAQRGELRQYLDDRDNHGSSPLSYAAELGHLDMFVLLLQQGAKLDAVNETVFELAARKGQAQIVETLLKRGYPVNTPARDVGTLESLTQATKYISGVFNEGIMTDRDQWKLMTRDTGQGSTVLHNAALFGHVSVVELLLKWNGNVRATTTKNWTPLHASSWTGQIECVKLLLDKGADASAVTDFGWIPYHCAASRGKTAVVELYIKLGLPVDAMTVKQKTALHLASWGGNAATVRTLVSCGAAINFQSYKGETPLHLAVRNLKPQIVELLLSFGANKYIINKDGLPVSDILRNFQGGGTADQKEMLRILDTFGMPGYIPWRPKKDPNAAAATAAQPTSLAVSGQPAHQRRPSTSSTFAMAQPNAPMTPSFDSQSQSEFKTYQQIGAQQSMFASPNVGFQQPNLMHSGPTIQPNLSSYPIPQLSMQNTTESFTPPPPYTPSPNAQVLPPDQHLLENARLTSVPSIYIQQSSTNERPLHTPVGAQMDAKPNEPNISAVTTSSSRWSPQPLTSPQSASDSPLAPQITSLGFSISTNQPHTQNMAVPQTSVPSHTPVLSAFEPLQEQAGTTAAATPTIVAPVSNGQANVPQAQPTPPPSMQQQPTQPQSTQAPSMQAQLLQFQPMQTSSMQSQTLQSHPTEVQTTQALSRPQSTQYQPMQAPLPAYPPQQVYGNPPAPLSPLLQQPMSTGTTQGFQQQLSQMSLFPSPNLPSSFTPQPQPQPQLQQQQPPQWGILANPNQNTNTQPYAQNSQLQYRPQPTQPFQQYPISPVQGYSPQQSQYQQSAGFLSVGVDIPVGVFGGQNGNMGSAMTFAPPPTGQQQGFQKKRSFRNLGGFLS